MSKRGTILAENIIFIVLNLVFISLLFLFVFSKTSDAAKMEEMYAKEIALLIDSSKPGMEIILDMKDATDKAKSEKWEGKIVSIQGNTVTVKLRRNGGHSYSFFNDVDFDKSYLHTSEKKDSFELIIKERHKNAAE